MKYMGSKRAMLANGLGLLIEEEIRTAKRFVDLFSGSGAVALHVARNFPIPVHAYDLQKYSAILCGAVLHRKKRIHALDLWELWLKRAKARVRAITLPPYVGVSRRSVAEYRRWCAAKDWPITKAYGGHYFSPEQVVWIDALRATLPKRGLASVACLAALIQAVSQCVASPGHTAQPFQPTRTARKFLAEAWRRDVLDYTRRALEKICSQVAKSTGAAKVLDANSAARQVRPGDLVFIDPPYSGVHYSRFYHVLETVAWGHCGEVSGRGRYPEASLRPRSRFSVKTAAPAALDNLLSILAARRARAVLTFPAHQCSNGLSGTRVRAIAAKHFHVKRQTVKSRFSTLGGTSDKKRRNVASRAARSNAKELILLLEPRPI